MFSYQNVNGDSYSLKEALYRGTPIVVCELPYFKEIGIKDNENAIFYNIDNSNVKEVAERMKTPLKFEFTKIEDGYNDILFKSKSKYKEEKLKMKKLEVSQQFTLGRFNEIENIDRVNPLQDKKNVLYVGDVFECEEDLARYLLNAKNSEGNPVVKEIKEQKEIKPEIKEETKPVAKRITRRRKRI